jgi:ankyrin repeat protein
LTIAERPKFSLVGATPFLLAAATGDLKTMKALLARGADPLLATEDGTTPLMAAAGIGRSEDRTLEEERAALEALKLISDLGGDVNAVNKNGLTAVHAAAYTGANEILRFLAAKGAKLNVMDKFGESPLSIAAGDPNGLAEDHARRLHPSTLTLLRKLTGDYTSLAEHPTVKQGE